MLYTASALRALFTTRVRVTFALFALCTFFALAPAAYGQANLTFTGGSGTPLTTTLTRSVSYTVNNANCTGAASSSPFFLFDEVGNPFGASQSSVTGTITYSINGGVAQTIAFENSGVTVNSVTANDLYIFGAQPLPGVANGSTVVLTFGSITTNFNVAQVRPADGSYTAFLVNGNNGIRCSTNGVALGPSAAGVSISGRVIANGLGLRNAQVSLTDGQGNVRQGRTSSFGYYEFDEVTAGETVILAVQSKQFQFAPRTVSVTDNIADLDFTAVQ